MAQKDKNFEIDEKKFYSIQFLGEKLFLISSKLVKIAGPVLGDFFKSGNLDKEINVVESLIDIISNLEPEEFLKLFKQIISDTKIIDENSGLKRDININLDYQGDLFGMIKLLKEIMLFNYSYLNVNSQVLAANLAEKKSAAKIKAI